MGQNGHFQPAGPVLPWRRWYVDRRVGGPPLTAREREVARLILRGLTNRQIADELAISDRTVGAHVQNILNKLGATNRVQIAAWAAEHHDRLLQRTNTANPPAAVAVAKSAHTRRVRPRTVALLVAVLVLLTLVPSAWLFLQDHATGAVPHGPLLFQATFASDGHEFGGAYRFGDPGESSIDIHNGGIEYAVFGNNGWIGNTLIVDPIQAYVAEYSITVAPRSNVVFWLLFAPRTPDGWGMHQLEIDTALESMQLMYGDPGDESALAAAVPVRGLLSGRTITIDAIVRPPHFVIYLDGGRVIDVTHIPSVSLRSPAFEIRGDDVGTVRITGIRIYSVS